MEMKRNMTNGGRPLFALMGTVAGVYVTHYLGKPKDNTIDPIILKSISSAIYSFTYSGTVSYG